MEYLRVFVSDAENKKYSYGLKINNDIDLFYAKEFIETHDLKPNSDIKIEKIDVLSENWYNRLYCRNKGIMDFLEY